MAQTARYSEQCAAPIMTGSNRTAFDRLWYLQPTHNWTRAGMSYKFLI